MPTVLDFYTESRASLRTTPEEKGRFRSEFQRFVRKSLREGTRLDEAFESAWERASQEVPISEASESELFEELILWAKSPRNRKLLPYIHQLY